jgi:hypothetical protein
MKNVNVSLGRIVFLAIAILIICAGSTMAQQSFRDLAEEYGAGWLIGRWTATTDDGTTILLVYKWELNGHLISVDMKMGEYASRGMIYFVPAEEEAVQVSVDNRGGRSKSAWESQGDKLISRTERVSADGEVQKSATTFSKVDAKTIKIALYGLDEDGWLADEPWFTMDFKRKAKKTTMKCRQQCDTRRGHQSRRRSKLA